MSNGPWDLLRPSEQILGAVTRSLTHRELSTTCSDESQYGCVRWGITRQPHACVAQVRHRSGSLARRAVWLSVMH